MNRLIASICGSLLAVVASGWAAELNSEQAKAVAEIERLGGRITIDEKSADKAVIKVILSTPLAPQAADSILKQLTGLTKLKSLALENVELSDEGLKWLRGLTNLRTVSLSSTNLSDAGLEHLAGLTNLEDLYLEHAKVSDAGLAHLSRLTRLGRLDLFDTEVSDVGLAYLKGMTNLELLHLGKTHVSDAGLTHLNGLTRLLELNLRDTRVTFDGVKQLQQALPNCTILTPHEITVLPVPVRPTSKPIFRKPVPSTYQLSFPGPFVSGATLVGSPRGTPWVELIYLEIPEIRNAPNTWGSLVPMLKGVYAFKGPKDPNRRIRLTIRVVATDGKLHTLVDGESDDTRDHPTVFSQGEVSPDIFFTLDLPLSPDRIAKVNLRFESL
jgi:hypothetical protein